MAPHAEVAQPSSRCSPSQPSVGSKSADGGERKERRRRRRSSEKWRQPESERPTASGAQAAPDEAVQSVCARELPRERRAARV